MSCGVDSFYTTLTRLDANAKTAKLTHLYCGNYAYGNDGPIYERAEVVAEELGLPLVKTATNINDVLKLPHIHTHFYKTIFGVLCVKKLFQYYYYSTTEDLGTFNISANATKDTSNSELLLLYAFSSPNLTFLTGGGQVHRVDKCFRLTGEPIVRRHLNVCIHPNPNVGCGTCGKCVRMLVTLDMADAVDKFGEVFDVEFYKKNRLRYFAYLWDQEHNRKVSPIFHHFLEKEPKLMEQAKSDSVRSILNSPD